VDNADERRIPQSGFLQESRFQVWPAAIHPQTPSVPETKRPPDFRDHRDTQRGNNPRNLHLLHASSMKKSAGRRSRGMRKLTLGATAADEHPRRWTGT
jgi:hypothetical protein